MSNWSIQVKGLDKFVAKMNKAGNPRALEGAMRESLKVVQQEAAKFPPQPSRTRSRHFNTWVREVGQLPRSAFGFTKAGKATIRRSGRAVLRKSEKMLQQWKTAQPQIRIGAGYIIGRVVNRASYAVFVQGDKQVKWHKQTGWKTVEQIGMSQRGRIVRVFEAAIKKMLAGLQ